MTEMLFRQDAYLRDAQAEVRALTEEGGIVLDRTVFYAKGGGQPGDSGILEWPGARMNIATAVKAQGDDIALVPAEPHRLPPVGTRVHQLIDWERRHRMMRIHTALHLMSVVIPHPVTGGQISFEKGRLDFMLDEDLPEKSELEDRLNALVDRDLPVTEDWISEAELEANPDLVKTLSVQPPRGAGRIRLVRIGQGDQQIDLQPCGGTHVARTGEIGRLHIGKIANKGRRNRRVNLLLDD